MVGGVAAGSQLLLGRGQATQCGLNPRVHESNMCLIMPVRTSTGQ